MNDADRHAFEQEKAAHALTRRTLDLVLAECKVEKAAAREEKKVVDRPPGVSLSDKLESQLDRYEEVCQKLKFMAMDRDEYRDRLLKAKGPEFFVVWNPHGSTPPRIRHTTHEEAHDAAITMANRYAGSTFYVLAEAGHAVSEGAEWHCDQRQYDEEIPF